MFSFGCAGSVAAEAFSLVAETGGDSSWGVWASPYGGFSCGAQALASGLQQLWYSVAPQHVETSWIKDQTCVPCIGRWILNTTPLEKSSPSVLKRITVSLVVIQVK